MKNLEEKMKNATEEILTHFNSVLSQHGLPNDVRIENISFKKMAGLQDGCHTVCQREIDPLTGQDRIVCRTVCD